MTRIAFSDNQIQLVGRVFNLQHRVTPNGTPVSNFSLGERRSVKDNTTGGYVNKDHYYNVVAFIDPEKAERFISGSVMVRGRLDVTTNESTGVRYTQIVADEIIPFNSFTPQVDDSRDVDEVKRPWDDNAEQSSWLNDLENDA